MQKLLWVATAACACCLAAERPVLSGTWRLDPAHSQLADSKLKDQTWSIEEKSDSVAISESLNEGGKERKIEIQCGTAGEQCSLKEAGQPTVVSMYYNGPVLVLLEQWHGNGFVTKKRIQASDDGKTLTIQVMHVAPPGRKDEVWTFVKQ